MPSNTFAAQAIDPQADAVVPESTALNQEPSSDQNVALIVGERAFATMEDVKTKISNADSHISNIEAENAQLRVQLDEANEKVATSQSLEEVLNSQGEKQEAGLTQDQIKELVGNQVSSIKSADVANTNRTGCINKAQTAYGDEFIVKMQEVATDIGLSMEDVDKMAESNPRLFERTFLPSIQARVAPAPTHTSTIRTSNFQEVPSGTETKPVLSLTSKERTAQFVRQLEALQQ